MIPIFAIFLCVLFWVWMFMMFPWTLVISVLALGVIGAIIGARSGVY